MKLMVSEVLMMKVSCLLVMVLVVSVVLILYCFLMVSGMLSGLLRMLVRLMVLCWEKLFEIWVVLLVMGLLMFGVDESLLLRMMVSWWLMLVVVILVNCFLLFVLKFRWIWKWLYLLM